MNVIMEVERINEAELKNGIYGGGKGGSWHDKYKNSAWVYLGGLPYGLTEGDVICVMSQWGEVEDVHLVRDKEGTNKSKGFCFVKYEDQRSTILAVDNFNGITLLKRKLRVDHVDGYRLPKEVLEREERLLEEDPGAEVLIGPGHAYKDKQLANDYTISSGVDLWNTSSATNLPLQEYSSNTHRDVEEESSHRSHSSPSKKKKKKKEMKKEKKKHHKHEHNKESPSSSSSPKEKKRSRLNDDSQDFVRSTVDADSAERERKRSGEGRGWSDNIEAQQQGVMVMKTSSAPPSAGADGAAMSWRGCRDPSLQARVESEGRRKLLADKNGPVTRRDEFGGFGGMNRRR